MRLVSAGVFLLCVAPAWGGYQYYLTDNLTHIDPNKWTTAGTVAATGGGLTAPDAAGGTLLSRIPVPDGTLEAEVRMTLTLLSSGGSYTAFVQASAGARTAGSGGGSYLAVEMQNPTFTNGQCGATFVVLQSTAAGVAALSSFPHSCRNGMTIRMAVHGSVLLFWPDQDVPMEFAIDPGAAAGQPGIGAHGTPAGNAISQVELGTISRVAPPALEKATASAFPNRIDLRWAPAAAPAASAGLAGYWVYRDGAYLGRTTAPVFQDEAVAPKSTHTYTIYAVDQHFNFSPAASVTVTAPAWPAPFVPKAPLPQPPARPKAMVADVIAPQPHTGPSGGFDPRRVGVQATGAYWGDAGEQIDVISGNLNFSVPLITAMSRGNWSVTFRLSYNSQMWRQDANGTWLLGQDVGYGFGWKLLAGAITPIWAGSQVDHYLYTDSTGAEYRLDQNNGGVWTSIQGTYANFDANANVLHFNDGSFWTLGCQSAGGEQDAGTLYPTTMEDSNGNYISIVYAQGSGSPAGNSSARILTITDSRAYWHPPYSSPSYTFSYNTDPIPHLTGIVSRVQTPEAYTFSYAESQPLASPFDGSAFGTTTTLQSVATTGLGIATAFQYDTSGEMTQMTTPLGGVLQWTYRAFTYGTGITLREVQNRYMPEFAGMGWGFWHNDAADAAQPYHGVTQVYDSVPTGSRVWWFGTTPSGALVVPTWKSERTASNTADNRMYQWAWTQDPAGNPYIYASITWVSPSSPSPGYATPSWPSTTTYQTLDTYGNLLQQQILDYGSNSPTWTYNFSYLHQANPSYTAYYIRNRLLQATATSSAGTITLVQNAYDGYPMQATIGMSVHDPAYNTNFPYRGNVTQRNGIDGVRRSFYQDTGAVYQVQDGSGLTVSVTNSADSNYSLPGVITPGGNSSLANTISYASSWAVTQVTSPNGATFTTGYDVYGRPIGSTSSDGAATTYTYTYNPNTQTATVNGRWTKTTLDGFGRTIEVDTGNGSTTVSVAETQYAPCACSPLGKLWRTSRPHAPGAPPIWTTYTYDASGRTIAVTLADGSTTTTAYVGNQTTVTDAAGKWKTYTRDAIGNLIAVTEPNPSGGANFVTSYTYNAVNQLLQVAMPRPYNGGTYTQTRTFTWSGTDLASETTPEAGTVQYQYDGAHHVTQRTDARGQQTQYSYDGYGRLTEVRHYRLPMPWELQAPIEQANQRVDYFYDGNPFDSSGFSQNTAGRLAAVMFHNEQAGSPEWFSYQYNYTTSGRVATQRLQFVPKDNALTGQPQAPVNFDVGYTWDNEGRMTGMQYPGDGAAGYGTSIAYDAMGRPSSMTSNGPNGYATPSATWGPAGELLTFGSRFQPNCCNTANWFGMSETRTYNPLGQLTRITATSWGGPTVMDEQYVYAAGQNNGRIAQKIDGVTGEQVSYTYDALNRLAGAQTADSLWGQQYSYDGWGNLTAKTVTKGTGPVYSQVYDPSLNRPAGTAPPTAAVDPTQVDVENRPLTTTVLNGGGAATYDGSGKRVFAEALANVMDGSGAMVTVCEIYLYGITGRKLATYSCGYHDNYDDGGDGTFWWLEKNRNVYFAGQPVELEGVAVVTDRLGSVRASGNGQQMAYYPYGEERTSTANGESKFGTYFRDPGGLDYADQRYYNSSTGSFTTPDPAGFRVARLDNPSSFNRFAYSYGDPINFFDPDGLDPCSAQYGMACFSATGTGKMPGNGGSGGGGGGGDGMQIVNDDGSGDGGGGGGGGGPDDSLGKAASTLWRAFDLALNKLDSEKCRSLFGNGAGSPDPRDVLTGLLYGTSPYGNLIVDDIPDKPGYVTSATTKLV